MPNKKGFTLTELLVVIVILGIITGISIPLIRNIQASNQDRQYKAYIDTVKYSAKLYTNSYEEDLFGHEKSGCAIVSYQEMVEKGLLKDIPNGDVSCNSSRTFAKIVKIDDKYGYTISLGCGKVQENGVVKVLIKYPEEDLEDLDKCGVDASTIMGIEASPSEDASINFKRRNINVKISSDTGIRENASISYGFSYGQDLNVIDGWHKLEMAIPGGNSQKRKIEAGKKISITSDPVTTPAGITNKLYLVVQINDLQDLSGRSWTTEVGKDNHFYFGTYTVDNTNPTFNNSRVVSSNNNYNSNTPKLDLAVTDVYALEKDLKMCISYDSDNCGTTLTDFRGSKYEKYDKNKTLDEIQEGYDGSNHTIYVTVVDPAGNYAKANYSYQLAQRYTLTYNSNGGEACSPNKKSVTFDKTSPTKWGELCTPKRDFYTFTGWNTKADGTGDAVTKETVASKNITIYAQWRKNRVIFRYKVLDGAVIKDETTASDGTVNHWSKNSDNFVLLNGNLYSQNIKFDSTTVDLANYNNSTYLMISKNGYQAVDGKQWICIDGCKSNNQTFSQASTSIDPKNICDMKDADCRVILKVNWNIVSYTITYTLNSGEVSGNPDQYNINTDTFTLKNPTRKGYSFKGWTGSNGTTGETSVSIPKGSTGNKSYTANWTLDSYSITYHLGGGSVTGNPDSYTVTTDNITLNNPSKSGYTFTGWTGSNGDVPQKTVTIRKGSTGRKEYTANWEINNYTITYNLNGGSVTGNPSTYTIESNTITLKNPMKSGYIFTGWTGSNGTTGETSVSIPKGSTGNKTYTANWRAEKVTLNSIPLVSYYFMNQPYDWSGAVGSCVRGVLNCSDTTCALGGMWKLDSPGNYNTIVLKVNYSSTSNRNQKWIAYKISTDSTFNSDIANDYSDKFLAPYNYTKNGMTAKCSPCDYSASNYTFHCDQCDAGHSYSHCEGCYTTIKIKQNISAGQYFLHLMGPTSGNSNYIQGITVNVELSNE